MALIATLSAISFTPTSAADRFTLEPIATVIEEVRTIATNAPASFPPTATWDSVSIINEMPMLDLDGNLFAYCIDVENTETSEFAFLLISVDTDVPPILQYSPFTSSPYIDGLETDEEAVYVSAGQHFKIPDDNYVSLTTAQTFSVAEVQAARAAQQQAEADFIGPVISNEQDFTSEREYYLSPDSSIQTQSTSTPSFVNVVLQVPNWQGEYGCWPTPLGMIMNYYGDYPKASVLYYLATYCGTQLDNTTPWETTISGFHSYLNLMNRGHQNCGWFTLSDNPNIPAIGADYNPMAFYKYEINSDRPLVVYTNGTGTATTTAYSSGFGAHFMVGAGYYQVENVTPYVILRTTASVDNFAYIPIDTLGDYAFLYYRP